jgi:hypothetical protein
MHNIDNLSIENKEKLLKEELEQIRLLKKEILIKEELEDIRLKLKEEQYNDIFNNSNITNILSDVKILDKNYIEISFEDFYTNYKTLKKYFSRYIMEEVIDIINEKTISKIWSNMKTSKKTKQCYQNEIISKILLKIGHYMKRIDKYNEFNNFIWDLYNPNIKKDPIMINYFNKILRDNFGVKDYIEFCKKLNNMFFLFHVNKTFNLKMNFPDVELVMKNLD